MPTSIHWHGLYLRNGMDGVGGLTQPYIKAGETAKYEWTLRQHGTFMFHSHRDEMTQMGMGLIGMFIVHPRNPSPDDRVDRDFSLMISEWAVKAGTSRPDTLEMTDLNVLTINGKVFPSTAPLVCKTGDRVRLRHLGATDHHPMHIHGHHFRVAATDGEAIPLSAQWPETTLLVAVGQARTIELITDAPGDWPFHCHMTHHVMNQMGHDFPNMVGMDPRGLGEKIRPLLPAYMTHGHTGMDLGVPTWIAPELDRLYQAYLAQDWLTRQDDPQLWAGIRAVPDRDLWRAHLDSKARLMRFLRERARERLSRGHSQAGASLASGVLLDPEVLTVGFARRFATYKRATLMLRDPARLRSILTDPRRPVQLVFAGKAHPADEPAKEVLRTVYQACLDVGYAGRIAFVEDYDMELARHLVQGVDVWLNTPRAPMEASGTSGQKAAINGIPNLSVLDGWWAEAFDGDNGWAIDAATGRLGLEAQDAADAERLYRLLEAEVAPLYYDDRDAGGVPGAWVRLMRRVIETITPRFSARRLLNDYAAELYGPAAVDAQCEWRGIRGAPTPQMGGAAP